MLSNEDILAVVKAFDAEIDKVIYFVDTDSVFKLRCMPVFWNSLTRSERINIIKNDSYFESEDEAKQAVEKVLGSRQKNTRTGPALVIVK